MRTRAKRFVLGSLIAILYLYCFPYFEDINSANEKPRIYLTQAMVDEGTFAIDKGIARWGSTADVSEYQGSHYSNKAPGSSFLAIPAYVLLKFGKSLTDGPPPNLAEMTWTFRFFTGMLPTLLFLMMLWRFLRRFAPLPDTRRLLLVGYGLGSMAMTYSVLYISHQLAAICIGTAYILSVWVIEEDLNPRWLWAVGLSAGAAPLCDYQAAFAGIPIAAYLIWHLLIRPYGNTAPKWRTFMYAVGGAIGPIALLLVYHARAFGHPLRTGYEASQTFAHFHQKGFLGMEGFAFERLGNSFFSMDNGLFIFCPMLLLAIPGWWLLGKRKQWWHLGITLSVVVIYFVFLGSINFWRGGWQLGPRYITAILPFTLVPIGVFATWSESRWPARALLVGTIGIGVTIYSISSLVFPHYPEQFSNPFFQLILRLIGDGHSGYNAGWLIGLKGWTSLIPFVACLFATLAWVAAPEPKHRKSALVGLGISVFALLLYSQLAGSVPPGQAAEIDRAYRFVESVMPE